MRGQVLEVGGPENLTVNEFVEVFRSETAARGGAGHVPLAGIRVGAAAMRILNPQMARMIQAAILMDTEPQAFDASPTRERCPSIPVTSLSEVVRLDFSNDAAADR